MAKTSYDVNYDDKRFTQVEKEEKAELKESNSMYDGMINSSDKYYDKQINAVENWGDTQAQLQQEQTDFTIEKIEQQKDQAHKDYLKEQSGAYVDWQKQSNQYGVNAEKQAENGLAFTGYSESSQVAMYNQYQNRIAVARETVNKAILEYDNMMKEARLQNNAALAQIAFQTLQTTLELSLQGFQYKNELVLAKADAKAKIKDRSYNKYQNVLAQINQENALAEQIRQYNTSLAEERRQFDENLALQKAKAFNSGGGGIIEDTQRLTEDDDNDEDNDVTYNGKTLNTNSVIDLGIGVISGDELAELVSAGYVSYNESNGKVAWTEKGKAKYGDKPTVSSYQKSKQTKKDSGTALDILGLR